MPLIYSDGKDGKGAKDRSANTAMKSGIASKQKDFIDNRHPDQIRGRRTSDFFQPILQKIFSAVASENITESFLNLSEEIKDFLGCESLIIYSVDWPAKQIFSRNLISESVEEKRLDISANSMAGFVALSGKEVNISDAYNPDELGRYPGLKHDYASDKNLDMKTKSALVFPVHHNGNLIGVIEILNNLRGKSFSAQVVKVARELSGALGEALDKLENEEKTEKLHSIGLAIQRAVVTEEYFSKLTEPILELFNAEMMDLYMVNEPRNEIYFKVMEDNNTETVSLPISRKSIAGWVAMDKRMVNIADVYNQDELRKFHPELKHDDRRDKSSGLNTKATLCCPLIYDNAIVGVLQMVNKTNPHHFHASDEKNIIALAQMLAIAIYTNKIFIQNKPHKYSYLLKQGILSAAELERAVSRSRKLNIQVERVFLDEYHLKREEIGKSLEQFYEIPFYGYDENNVLPKHYFVGLNMKFLMKNFWVPVQNDDNLVVVLLDNPMDVEKVRSIKMAFPKKEIQFRVGLRVDILSFLNAGVADDDDATPLPDTKEDVSSLLESIKSSRDYEGISEAEDEEEDSSISESDNSIVRLVNKIIVDAYLKGVSDIHIEPGIGKNPLLVRYRTEGECYQVEKIPYNYKHAIVSRIKIMAKLDIAERRLPQDGKIKMKYGSKVLELRVATCPTVGSNEDVVMRILAASKPFPLDGMNLSADNYKIVRRSVTKPYGLILCVGPTGSGKTTTLHSCLGFINAPNKKIWTAEDPVEITQPGLRQVQVHPKIGLDFARAMRSFLRGDPDVIMVGEMRDKETASIGLEASLTGHLVFSTLHTNSAPETITRLIDMGMNTITFADALIMILAQRLVKTLCIKCKESYHPNREEFDILASEYGEEYFPKLGVEYGDKLTLYSAVGCELCKGTGYAGRTGLHEVLEATPDIKRMITKNSLMEDIRALAMKEGMTTLKQDGIYKIFKGDCDLHQVSAVCLV